MKRVSNPNEVPKGFHYAVIIYDKVSVYIEGDERSRTHPGHGYPAHTETYNSFEHWVTEDKEVWTAFIEKNIDKLDKMVCLEVNKKASVTKKTVITTD